MWLKCTVPYGTSHHGVHPIPQHPCWWSKPWYFHRQYSVASTASSWWEHPHILLSYSYPPIPTEQINQNLTQQYSLFYDFFWWGTTLNIHFPLSENICWLGCLDDKSLPSTRPTQNKIPDSEQEIACHSLTNGHVLCGTNMKPRHVHLLTHFIIDSSKQ